MPRDRSSPEDRSVLVMGALLMLLAAPPIFLALVFASGGEMLSSIQSNTERLRVAAFVGFPIWMFAIGASLIYASWRGTYIFTLVTVAALLCDVVAVAVLTRRMKQPEPQAKITVPNPEAVIKGPVILTSRGPELRPVYGSSNQQRCEAPPVEAVKAPVLRARNMPLGPLQRCAGFPSIEVAGTTKHKNTA